MYIDTFMYNIVAGKAQILSMVMLVLCDVLQYRLLLTSEDFWGQEFNFSLINYFNLFQTTSNNSFMSAGMICSRVL